MKISTEAKKLSGISGACFAVSMLLASWVSSDSSVKPQLVCNSEKLIPCTVVSVKSSDGTQFWDVWRALMSVAFGLAAIGTGIGAAVTFSLEKPE